MENSLISIVLPMLPALIFIIIVLFLFGVARRMEKRADERLKLDKENATLLQKQIEGINKRLTNIEKTLKEVE